AATSLNISNKGITSLQGLEYFTNITTLKCQENNFPVLDAGFLVAMESLDFSKNPDLVTVNLSNLESVQGSLGVRYLSSLVSIDLGKLTYVGGQLECSFNNVLTSINLNSLESTGAGFGATSNNVLTTINTPNLVDVGGSYTVQFNPLLLTLSAENLTTVAHSLSIYNNYDLINLYLPLLNSSGGFNMHHNVALTSISVPNLQSIFKWGSSSSFDGDIYLVENDAVVSVDFSALETLEGDIEIGVMNNLTSVNFDNLISVDRSIEISTIIMNELSFPSLVTVYDFVYYNNIPSTLSLASLVSAHGLGAGPDFLTDINLSSLQTANSVIFSSNILTSLHLDNLISATTINISDSNLTEFSANSLQTFGSLNLGFNELETLDFPSFTGNVGSLRLYANQLTDITFGPNLTSVDNLLLESNQFVTLDISNVPVMNTLNLDNNQLLTVFIKNGTNENLTIANNPNLQYVCADEEQLADVNTEILDSGSSIAHANSYCSFVLGGDYFEVKGSVKNDFNANGCDPLDNPLPYFQLHSTDGTNSGVFLSNSQGEYSIPVQEGTHTITPVLENTDYFTISPTEFTVNFPADPTPFLQDFCILPNGNHPDLEIEIIPSFPARPGFETSYKIVYHNKGTQIQSGEIKFRFYPVTQFVSSIPDISSQDTENLYYDYVDLKPFETREINLIMNVNGPMDNPPINIGDYLGYKATIYPVVDDETPNDNKFELKQQVVGSLDPNDKTCLQGESVGPETAGEYVHYLIRFENTGNYPAENIVVKDVIDSEKFEVSTLRALNGSHEFYSRIKENVVEFIFENINLPFDDQNNDGYVLFKIKTKPELQLGDTFSNEAAIYFDYNFPVITNEYITTIEEQLETPDFEFNNEFVLYPNPSKNILNIQKKSTTEISSVEIYNLLGQVVIAIPSKTEMIDVSSLKAGTYFVKLNSNKGKSYSKFIKE
ncbi:MAG TPA: T9SS type A sorting domain-containing protein, partial [Aequorivita sp.]|nr:T9SS type A sorting domain-containing protein [Aequorivita sp.]